MYKNKKSGSLKPTIGILADNIRPAYHNSILRGIKEQAAKDNFNILCFDGKPFASLKAYNECFNIVYDLLDNRTLDYLILLPGLFDHVTKEQAKEIIQTFPPLPVIIIGTHVEGYTSVVIDNRTGLHDLIEHIITVHKRKNLAFIKGPTGIFDADQRFEVFAEVLKEQGIPLKPELIIEDGHFMYEDGPRAIEILMDERKLKPGKDFDTVIGVNDQAVIGAYDALTERGVHIPGEVSIAGFDDFIMGSYLASPLATVRQPIEKLGIEAVRCIAEIDKAPMTRLVHTDMVIRESCGCDTKNYAFSPEITKRFSHGSIEKTMEVIKPTIVSKMMDAIWFKNEEKIARQLIEKLTDAFILLLKNKERKGFIDEIMKILETLEKLKEDISLWNNAIDIMVNLTISAFQDAKLIQEIDHSVISVLTESNKLISMAIKKTAIQDRDAFDLYVVYTRNGEQRIKVALEMGQLVTVITNTLIDLDFHTFHLFLYQDQEDYSHNFKQILSCVNKEKQQVNPDTCLYTDFNMIIRELIKDEKLYTYMILPVIYKENAFGFLIFKESENPNARIIYDDLTSQIGSTFQNIKLINEIKTAYSKLELAQKKLQREMEVARNIQISLLPRDLDSAEFDIAAKMMTAIEVSGDYYDFVRVEGRDWFVVGDVSGHGVHAGLIMMMVQTSIHLLLKQFPDISPEKLLCLINEVLRENIKKLGDDKYMTINVIACREGGKFVFSGMYLPLFIYRQKTRKVEEIAMRGMWLGMMDDIAGINKDNAFILHQGDGLLLYTDGILEARNTERAMYGIKRLAAVYEKSGHLSSHQVIDNIIADIGDFSYDDDVTLFVVKRMK